MNMSEVITGITLTKSCKVREEKGGIAKTIHLSVIYDGATLKDVFEKSLEPVVIQYQAKARNDFDNIRDGASVEIKFTAPARTTVDPLDVLAARAKAAGRSVVEQFEFERKQRGM